MSYICHVKQKQSIMSYTVPAKLLSDSNTKTKKGEAKGWYTYILSMSPANQNDLGVNMCPQASKGCAAACLFGAGRGSFSNVEKGRINKTHFFKLDNKAFMTKLDNEISKLTIKHEKKGEKLCIRLNGMTDQMFEKIKVRDNKNIFELHPNVQFYDYTKITLRLFKELPSNYHLTFSRSEENQNDVERVLDNGGNVAVVFDKLPETYLGYEVINGDETDLRFLDKKNVVVGLKYKKMTGKDREKQNADALNNGFVVKVDELTEKELFGNGLQLVA
jgi:hypothetical protein